jgi:L-malate glycosyltransferase
MDRDVVAIEFSRRVIIAERRLTHYRVPLYERIRKLLADKQIDFKLLVGRGTLDEIAKCDGGYLPWATDLPTHYFFSGAVCWQPFGGHLRDVDLVIVNHQTKLLYNQRLFWGPRRWRLGLWGHGRNMQAHSPDGLRERFKRWTIFKADWYFAYTQITVDAVAQTGFPVARITNLNNTIDTSGICRDRDSITQEELALLKTSLGIAGMPVGVFLGSLYPDKRLDFLFEACQRIRQRLPTFQWLIIGDGVERAKVQGWTAAHDWVYWVGSQLGRAKVLYLGCADVMLNPGAVGLGIVDSFVCGVPLVTTDCGQHGPEIAYLQHGGNGLMTRDEVDDFAVTVSSLLTDPASLKRMSQACLTDANKYSLDAMATRFVNGMAQALASPRYSR